MPADDRRTRRTAGRLRVHQHLTIASIERADVRVAVTVRQRDRRVHHITFTFDDTESADDHVRRLAGWMRDQRALTYVVGDEGGALIDDAEAFRLAFGEELPEAV